ncbi:MAG: cold-shock protein [Luteibaculum sp.]
MGKSQETFNKKEKEKKRLKKRQDKLAKKEERKAQPKKSSLDDMIAYVDEFGNITDTPPDLTKKKEVKAENIELGVPSRSEEDFDPIRKGKIGFFNDEKGFGFIKENETNEKFFVHISALSEEVVENDKVTFEVEQGLKGLNAVRVKKV